MKRKISNVAEDTKATREDTETIKGKAEYIKKVARTTGDDVKYLIKETKDMRINLGMNAGDTKYLIATTAKTPVELYLLGFCFAGSLKKLHPKKVACSCFVLY